MVSCFLCRVLFDRAVLDIINMGLSAPLVGRSHFDLAGRPKELRKVCTQVRDLLGDHGVYINRGTRAFRGNTSSSGAVILFT